MKKFGFILFVSVFLFVNFVRGQLNIVDSVFIYNPDGTQEWYKVQKDVFCFALTDNSKYTGALPPCVDTVVYYRNVYTPQNEEQKQITVYDLSGKLLLDNTMKAEISLKINLNSFEAGIYLLHIHDMKGNYFSTKLIR